MKFKSTIAVGIHKSHSVIKILYLHVFINFSLVFMLSEQNFICHSHLVRK